jgi:serine/threonine protein kinase
MMEADFAEKLIRKVLPGYEVKEKLGEGTFGAVFKIKDELKERAAKFIMLNAAPSIEKGAVTSAGTKIERDFRHIVESYEQIACDEIVSVYDFYRVSTDENARREVAYAIVVMEIYPSNLSDYLVDYFHKNNRPLDMERARIVVEKLALLLGNLYTKRGFLFEDLKPENLLIKEQGADLKLVVGDIGGLKSLGSVSQTGSQVTLSYCAAEVLRKGQKPDLRSIMYSYGLICYYVIEGHLPYEDCGVTDRIDLIREKGLVLDRTDIPDNLKKVIEKCLAFEPEHRYKDFNEIVEAICGRAVQGEYRMGEATVDLESLRYGGGTIDLGSFGKDTPPNAGPAREGKDSYYRTAVPEDASIGMTSSLTQRMMTEKRRMETIRISDEKDAINKVSKEIRGLIVRSGDLYKLQNESYKVYQDIRVEKGALLMIENSKLYFDENAGIVSLGTLRAKDSVFSAIDFSKKWKNIVLMPSDTRINILNNCKFRFMKGRTWKSLKHITPSRSYALNDDYLYGGAIFMAEIKEKMLAMNGCEFYNCSAHEGGALFCLKADPAIENCVFDNCTAGYSGGGMKFVESNPVINNCRVSNCSSNREGGGICCLSSKPTMVGCTFDNCATKYLYGGGLYVSASFPVIKNCKFNRCVSTREGGGLYCDEKSRPKITYPSFTNCKPNNSNCV